MNVLAVLQKQNTLSSEDVIAIQKEVQEKKQTLSSVLMSRGITEESVLAALSKEYEIPARTIDSQLVTQEVLQLVPEESARHYRFVPLEVKDNVLALGIVDPDSIATIDAIQFIASRLEIPFKTFLISENDFNKVLDTYKDLSGEVGDALSELGVGETKSVIIEGTKKDTDQQEKQDDFIKADAPVTKIVSTVLRYAVEGGASDIHIEAAPDKTRVRFRMDGDLHTSLQVPSKVHAALIARIKILSQMRLDEKRKPQDGRFSATIEGKRIDFRVSTFPTQYGEKVVMRILDKTKSIQTLDSLGLSEKDLGIIREVIKAPYGIILISGPTGSGKSTTLFALLSELDRETANVVSVEDPIEYEIPLVAQSQVRPEIGYTFAAGLRSILRQDPDIIMVGEIRDKETAQLAIQAALTGHLVFSTIHTNTACGAIPRLVDMGIDPYLIAPTLTAVIGQRLVRRMCEGAGDPFTPSESVRMMFEKQFSDLPEEVRKEIPPFTTLYHAKTTPECPNGTRGRMAVTEVLRMDSDLEEIILKNPVEEAVYATARKKGMLTMREDAILKALSGKIPFEEIATLGGDFFVPEENELNNQPTP